MVEDKHWEKTKSKKMKMKKTVEAKNKYRGKKRTRR